MIYITANENNDVVSTNHMPFHEKYGLGKTMEDLEKTGYFVESIPEPDNMPSKGPILKFNPTTKTIYYDFVDIPKSQEEILQETITALGQTIAEEKIKNMQKDDLISSLGQELTKVKLEIMQLKGGI